MKLILTFSEIRPEHRALVGGKGLALARMAQQGFRVPPGACITIAAYDRFVDQTGLRSRIMMELSRKRFEDMRWEEMWDASLRIRNMFATTKIPKELSQALRKYLDSQVAGAVAVRSSAPAEDAAHSSFAGLHASFVNVRGALAILDHVKLVWASLWSDAALLYRRELGLDIAASSMAVVVQEIIAGEKSGVVFSQSPQQEGQAVVEAVYGLNQGLVDGTVEPDRWVLNRGTGAIMAFTPALRNQALQAGPERVALQPLAPAQLANPPLTDTEVSQVLELAKRAENLFGTPQDVEWTFQGEILYTLQSRPITTSAASPEDDRPWYLSLRRSFENLKVLRNKVEGELIPALEEEADRLAGTELSSLAEPMLVEEISRRARLYQQWKKIYWDEFIPLAHGIRIFGLVYNDAVHPEDPYEFMDLLGATDMVSLKRNRALEELAALIRQNPRLAEDLRAGAWTDLAFSQALSAFQDRFGDLFCGAAHCPYVPETLINLLLEMAARPPSPQNIAPNKTEELKKQFLRRFAGASRVEAEEYLDLGRAAYRLRDDDNIYLNRLQAQLVRALMAHKARVEEKGLASDPAQVFPPDVAGTVAEAWAAEKPAGALGEEKMDLDYQARQILGQPASPGLASGSARVILDQAELFDFKSGEILVVDALDPAMTFVVPLAAGIVERRGGMLIHGSIIAREYRIPCVTGVPQATGLISTGDRVTVDGFLGIVVLG